MSLKDRLASALLPRASEPRALEGVVERAPVAPTSVPDLTGANVSGSWWGSLAGAWGVIREPFAGAWQRNLSEAATPSIVAFSSVYACVSAISGDISKLPICIKRKNKKGGFDDFPNHPMSRIVWKPNGFQTRNDFIQQVLVSALLAGNAYIWKQRDNRGVIKALYVLNPRDVQVLVAETGDIFYRCKREVLAGQGKAQEAITFPASEIIHHRLMTLEHPLFGVTPLYAAGTAAQVGARIIMNSTAFFGNQSRPSGILTAPGKLSKDDAIDMKARWEENFGGRNSGRTAVLSNGLKWEAVTITPNDAQLIEQLRFTTEDVARAFRVPMFVIGADAKVTYKNSEQAARAYYSGCLQYHIEALESRLDDGLELANDVYLSFDLDPLLRTETDLRFTAWQTSIQSGFKTINEVRAKEGDPPIKGGDEPLVQVQFVPLSQLGEAHATMSPTTPTPAPAPAPTEPTEPKPKPAADDSPSDKDVEELFNMAVRSAQKERIAA